MFCRNCGKQINDEFKYCPFCGTATTPTTMGTQEQSPAQAQTPASPKKNNGFAIAGFVLSLVSIYFGAFFCVTPALGLIFSILGLTSCKDENTGRGLSLAGIIISSILFVFWFIYFVMIIMGVIIF